MILMENVIFVIFAHGNLSCPGLYTDNEDKSDEVLSFHRKFLLFELYAYCG